MATTADIKKRTLHRQRSRPLDDHGISARQTW